MSCTLCDLCRNRQHAVPGEGPSNAPIMLIGEAPGIEEDRTGRPFVGRAGKLLTDALKQSGLEREKTFITSIIKCRPPKNRKPKAFEIRSCLPYLWLQIKIIDPKLICLMGNISASAVLNMQGITTLHGQIFRNRYLITFHPAAILRNRNLMEAFTTDLKMLKDNP
jgi:uracil-DNA glycosylase